MLDDETKRLLDTAASNATRRRGKERWTRATFLKWACFREWEFDEILFLDCDMVCIGSLSPLFEFGGDVVGCPQFKTDLYRADDKSNLPAARTRARIRDFVSNLGSSRLSLNSGVMVLRSHALTTDFFERIVDFTATVSMVNEQRYITEFLVNGETSASLEFVTPVYNFQAEFLGRVTWYEQLQYVREIRVMHYAGPNKPWSGNGQGRSLGSIIWHSARREAERHMGPLPNPS